MKGQRAGLVGPVLGQRVACDRQPIQSTARRGGRNAAGALLLLLVTSTGCGQYGADPRQEPIARQDRGSPYGEVADGVAGSWGEISAGAKVREDVWGPLPTPRAVASIGDLESKAETTLLGPLRSMAFGGERVYLLDSVKLSVEIFGFDGSYEGTAGRPGEGPGEYMQPSVIRTDDQGHLWIRALFSVHKFTSRGEHIHTYRTESRGTFADRYGFRITSGDGILLSVLHRQLGPFPLEQGWGLVVQDPDGQASPVRPVPRPADFEERRMVLKVGPEQSFFVPAPYYPGFHWTVTPGQAIVVGVAGSASLEIHHPDGRTVPLRLPGGATEITEGEKAWHRDRLAAVAAKALEVTGWKPRTDPFPDHKPFFAGIVPDEVRERIWVIRVGRGKRWPDCAEHAHDVREFRTSPCWSDTYSMDAFSLAGSYLGSAPLPVGTLLDLLPVVRDNLVLLQMQNPDGNVSVRLYDLQIPR